MLCLQYNCLIMGPGFCSKLCLVQKCHLYLDVMAGTTAEEQATVLQRSTKYESYFNKTLEEGKTLFIDIKQKKK